MAALALMLGLSGCAGPDAAAPPAPAPPAPTPAPAPAPPLSEPSTPPAAEPAPPARPLEPATPPPWRLETSALAALDGRTRLLLVEATAAALEAEARAMVSSRRSDAGPEAAAIASDVAVLCSDVRAELLAVAVRLRAGAALDARLAKAEDLARERLRRALAERSSVAPVGSAPPPSELAATVRALEVERVALLDRLAPVANPDALATPPAEVAGPERGTVEAARALAARAGAASARDPAAGPAVRIASALADTAVASAAEAARALDEERLARRRERDVSRVTEEAVGLELERARRRQDELLRAQADARARDDEQARLARRERDVASQLDRLQALLDQAERRRREEAAAIAAIESRTANLDLDQDPALRGHRATLADLQRRLEGARRIRDGASSDLAALRASIGGLDPHAPLRDGFPERLASAEAAWEVAHDATALRALLAEAEAAAAEVRARMEAHEGRATAADRAAADAEAVVAASLEEGRRRAAYLAVAPVTHRQLLEAVEDVRGMLEATRREEARNRRDEARAAWQRSEDERRLDAGALRRSADELRAFAADVRADVGGWAAALSTEPAAARSERTRRGLGLLAAALVVVVVAWRARRRLQRRAQVIIDRKADPATRTLATAGDRAAFGVVYLAGAIVPWLAAFVIAGLAGVALDVKRDLVRRALLALGVLLAARALAALDHLLFREGRLRALVDLRPENRQPLHDRLQWALIVLSPLAATHVLVRDLPELWATAIVTQGLLAVGVILTLLAVLQVARGDVVRALRFPLPPRSAGADGQPAADRVSVIDLAKAGYNRVIEGLLGLVLLDVLGILTLWVVGWVEPAGALLRGTVQTVLTLTGGVLLLVAIRGGGRTLLDNALRGARGPGLQVLASVVVFVLSRLLELVLACAVALSLWDAWGGDARPVLTLLRSERALGVALAAGKIVLALAVAIYANRVIGFGIDAFVEQTLRTADAEVARRRDTFVPLVKSAVRYVVILSCILYSATQAGFDLVSIVAGLGVLGLAVAFGAQTLVKDVITGVFVIVDDDLAVGDWVRIGSVEGTVEHVGVRTAKLRTLQGVLVSIPNGSIAMVENWNRGWNRAVLDIEVAYESDVDKAMVVLKELADEYRRQRPDLLVDAPEVQGVISLGNAVTLRLRVRTAPLAVWQVERELRLRAVMAFEDQGLEIPYDRQVILVRTETPDGQLVPLPLPGIKVGHGGQSMALAAPGPAPAVEAAPSAAFLPPGVTRAPAPDADRDGRAAGRRPELFPAPRGTGRLDAHEVAARIEAAARSAPAAPQSAPVATAASSAPASSSVGLEAELQGLRPNPPGGVRGPTDEPSRPPSIGDASGQPIASEPQRTRRVVLSSEAMERLKDANYVRSVTAEEPVVPAEMQASFEAIEKARAAAEATRAPEAASDGPRAVAPGAEGEPAAAPGALQTASGSFRRPAVGEATLLPAVRPASSTATPDATPGSPPGTAPPPGAAPAPDASSAPPASPPLVAPRKEAPPPTPTG